ncbi:hypothetical protein [Mesorhizobium sp.]|uniref:sunset domain-containing protein n=1 Tax=Mesorhizobium sp. TaxID=1871066 RepID=UPI002579FEBB|nr:hypothetical protein [Mesorhizobium sp.]
MFDEALACARRETGHDRGMCIVGRSARCAIGRPLHHEAPKPETTNPVRLLSGSCDIKGNISNKGVRIYHLPGQRFYNETVISPANGERMFCSEDEARAAGWRRSKR